MIGYREPVLDQDGETSMCGNEHERMDLRGLYQQIDWKEIEKARKERIEKLERNPLIAKVIQ